MPKISHIFIMKKDSLMKTSRSYSLLFCLLMSLSARTVYTMDHYYDLFPELDTIHDLNFYPETDSFNFYTEVVETPNASSNDASRPYRCSVDGCNKSYKAKKTLSEHKRTKHTKKLIFQCDYPGCKKEYSGYAGLLYHRRKHEGDLRYECSLCSKKFMQKGELIHHSYTHSGEKPHSCPKCNKAFSWKGNCDRHKKTCKVNHAIKITTKKRTPYKSLDSKKR